MSPSPPAAAPPRPVIAIVPARGGSKGIPRKNARPFGGEPLVARAVRGAVAATTVTRVLVSTDDAEMLALATGAGAEAPFGLRPAALATDTARTVDVLAHALDAVVAEGGADEERACFVMLQPTSPFRTPEDIDGAVRRLWEAEADGVEAVVSVCEAAHHPMKMHKLTDDGRLAPFVVNPYGTVNRKELPLALQENGSMYVQSVASFRRNSDKFYCGLKSDRIAPYVMPPESSVDLDTETDWEIAEALLAARSAGKGADVETDVSNAEAQGNTHSAAVHLSSDVAKPVPKALA